MLDSTWILEVFFRTLPTPTFHALYLSAGRGQGPVGGWKGPYMFLEEWSATIHAGKVCGGLEVVIGCQ